MPTPPLFGRCSLRSRRLFVDIGARDLRQSSVTRASLVAGNGCLLEVRGRRVRLADPRIVHDESRRDVPPIVRTILGLLAVTDFLRLTTESTELDRDCHMYCGRSGCLPRQVFLDMGLLECHRVLVLAPAC